MAKSERAKAKDKAWAAFSRYIRVRDALKTTGDTEYAACYTCGKMHPITEMDAGHWITRNHLGTFMDERNVHAQCRGCNRFGNGRPVEYQEHLLEEYGPDILQVLTRAASESRKVTAEEYRDLERFYKASMDALVEAGYYKATGNLWRDMMESA